MTHTDISNSPSRPDRTLLLTGPTSGIGAAALHHLLRHPASPALVLLARDPGRLSHVADEARSLGMTVEAVPVDLSDLGAVDAAVERVRYLVDAGAVPPLNTMALVAGVQMTDRHHASAQGHELTFAVNVLAQHALLRGLEPALAPGAHMVLLGSSTHRGKRASFGLVPDPQWRPPAELANPAVGPLPSTREPGGIAYATSKLALVTLSHEWADRLAASGRRLNVYDPGLVAGTGLGRDMRPHEYWVWRHLMPAMSVLPKATTPTRTARHLVALALGDTHPGLHDGYIEMGRVTRAEATTLDPDRRRALWAWCEQALAARSREQGA